VCEKRFFFFFRRRFFKRKRKGFQDMVLASSGVVTAFVLICPVIGLIFALIYTRATAAISFSSKESHGALQEQASQVKVVAELTEMIADGAHSLYIENILIWLLS
jgi:hypothetical protein